MENEQSDRFCNACKFYQAEKMFCMYKKEVNDPLKSCEAWEEKNSGSSYIDADAAPAFSATN